MKKLEPSRIVQYQISETVIQYCLSRVNKELIHSGNRNENITHRKVSN